MIRNRLVFLSLSLAVMAVVLFGSLSLAADRDDEGGEGSLYKYLSVFTEVLNLVRQSYVEAIPTQSLFTGALDGTVDALDPFSTYVPAAAVEEYLRSLEVGDAHSGLIVAKDRGIFFAAAVAPESPAAEVEIKAGDIISRVDGQSTRETPLWKLQSLLAGAEGAELPVEILRQGESLDLTLVLRRFASPSPTLEEQEGAAVVRLGDFGPETAAQLSELLGELADEQQDRLLLDLRGLADIDSEPAFAVAELFVSGDLGELKNRSGALRRYSSDAEPAWAGHLVVLVDRSCVGSAEVLARLLRDGAGAEIVGQRTFGYAGHLGLVELSDGSRVRLTDSFYTGRDGAIIDEGLEPDIVVNGTSRGFDESETSLEEIIFRRGLERLLEIAESVERLAA